MLLYIVQVHIFAPRVKMSFYIAFNTVSTWNWRKGQIPKRISIQGQETKFNGKRAKKLNQTFFRAKKLNFSKKIYWEHDIDKI